MQCCPGERTRDGSKIFNLKNFREVERQHSVLPHISDTNLSMLRIDSCSVDLCGERATRSRNRPTRRYIPVIVNAPHSDVSVPICQSTLSTARRDAHNDFTLGRIQGERWVEPMTVKATLGLPPMTALGFTSPWSVRLKIKILAPVSLPSTTLSLTINKS